MKPDSEGKTLFLGRDLFAVIQIKEGHFLQKWVSGLNQRFSDLFIGNLLVNQNGQIPDDRWNF